jgi:hypothetical protein
MHKGQYNNYAVYGMAYSDYTAVLIIILTIIDRPVQKNTSYDYITYINMKFWHYTLPKNINNTTEIISWCKIRSSATNVASIL